MKKVQVLREKELQKLEGAPAGYIGRKRTKGTYGERDGGWEGEKKYLQAASEVPPRQENQIGLESDGGVDQAGRQDFRVRLDGRITHSSQMGQTKYRVNQQLMGQHLSLNLSNVSNRSGRREWPVCGHLPSFV